VRFSFHPLLRCLAFLVATGATCQASSTPGCSIEKGYYQCNRAAFLTTLNEAKTVAVESRPFDQATTNSLSRLARTLHKTEISDSADLTFVLIKTQAEGIFYGPSQRELASFLVYLRDPEGAGRRIIWIETLDGEPDIVWPIVVFNIIRQFKTGIQ
jgi:hypothetical protein